MVVGGAPHITLSVCWTACTSIQKIRWAPIAFWSTCFNSVFFFVSGQHDTTRGGGEEGQPHGHLSSCWRLPHAIKTKVAIPKKLYLGFVVNEGLCTNLFVWLNFHTKKNYLQPYTYLHQFYATPTKLKAMSPGYFFLINFLNLNIFFQGLCVNNRQWGLHPSQLQQTNRSLHQINDLLGQANEVSSDYLSLKKKKYR